MRKTKFFHGLFVPEGMVKTMQQTKKQTYTITPVELLKEYRINDELRKRLDIGCFVYVENMLVVNDPFFVTYEAGHPLLTDFDRDDLSKCALRFDVVQLSFKSKQDVFGDRNALQDKSFAADVNVETPTNSGFLERQKKIYTFINTIQGLNCWDMIKSFLMFVNEEKIIYTDDDIGTDMDIFCDRTNLGDYYYKRAMGMMERTETIAKEAILAFAAGYELYADMAEIFLKSAGHTLSLSLNDDVCYRLVLNIHTQSPIEVKNAELAKYGVKKNKLLGSKQRR